MWLRISTHWQLKTYSTFKIFARLCQNTVTTAAAMSQICIYAAILLSLVCAWRKYINFPAHIYTSSLHLIYQNHFTSSVLIRNNCNNGRDLNVHIMCPCLRKLMSAQGRWNEQTEKKKGEAGKGELAEWEESWWRWFGVGGFRQSWFSFSNKSDNPSLLLWRPPLSPFLSASYHLSLLPFSQQGMWVCVLLCVGSWMNQANEGESH